MVKVERSFPAPASLAYEAKKKTGSYSEPDVVCQLKKDFHNKCYICELDRLQDPEIEHLLPHKNGRYPERKFDWDNLFWACRHCNGIKNQQKYDEGILDCCKQEPEEFLSFHLKDGNVEILEKKKDTKAELTAQLILEVFNLRNTGIRVCASELRLQELNKEMNKLYSYLEKLKENSESKVIKGMLRAMLRRESKFAAFKREYIRENAKYFPQLIQYCNLE